MPSQELQWALAKMTGDRERAGVSADYYSVEAARAALPPTELPDPPGTQVSDVMVGKVPCKWVLATNADPAIRILYLHGGGYSAGNFQSHRTLASWLAHATRGHVLFPEYRLAPENKFPAGLNDAFAAYRHILESDFGAPGASPGRVFLAGDSAGAGLSISVMRMALEAGLRLPAAAALLCGMYDLDETSSRFLQSAQRTRDMARLYVAWLEDLRNPLASQILAQLHGLPPLLIQTGSADYCREDSVRLEQRARDHGVHATLEVWPEMFHVWHRFAPRLPQALQALDRVAEFFRSVASPRHAM